MACTHSLVSPRVISTMSSTSLQSHLMKIFHTFDSHLLAQINYYLPSNASCLERKKKRKRKNLPEKSRSKKSVLKSPTPTISTSSGVLSSYLTSFHSRERHIPPPGIHLPAAPSPPTWSILRAHTPSVLGCLCPGFSKWKRVGVNFIVGDLWTFLFSQLCLT